MTFREWLAGQLAAHQQSPMEVAIRLGLLESDVQDWLAGQSVPDPIQCGALATWFDQPPTACLRAAGWSNHV